MKLSYTDKLIFGIEKNSKPSINELKANPPKNIVGLPKTVDQVMVEEGLRVPKLDVIRHKNGNRVAFYNKNTRYTIKQLKTESKNKPFTKTFSAFNQLRSLSK